MPAILSEAFSLLATPKGAFIYGNDTKAKTVSNLPLGFLEYGMTSAVIEQ